jgi:hypothetical protein
MNWRYRKLHLGFLESANRLVVVNFSIILLFVTEGYSPIPLTGSPCTFQVGLEIFTLKLLLLVTINDP